MKHFFSSTPENYRPTRLKQYIFSENSIEKYSFTASNIRDIAYESQNDWLVHHLHELICDHNSTASLNLCWSGKLFAQNESFLKKRRFSILNDHDEHTHANIVRIRLSSCFLKELDFDVLKPTHFPFEEYSIDFFSSSLEYQICVSALCGHTEFLFKKPLLVVDMDYLKRLGFKIHSRSNCTLVSWYN